MIEFHHVYMQYVKDQYALEDITLNIGKGEFVFLTGASGAGKTTLLKLIFKEELPTKGQILVDSTNIGLTPRKELHLLRRDIGIVFQDFKLLDSRTVFENVAVPLLVRGEKKTDIQKMVTKALHQVGISHRKNYIPSHISGGEQQRVAIARAIVGNPKIIIADEPTGNLDTELSKEVFSIFEKINANGITTIIATHDDHLMRMYPKRILRLDAGKLVAGGKRQTPRHFSHTPGTPSPPDDLPPDLPPDSLHGMGRPFALGRLPNLNPDSPHNLEESPLDIGSPQGSDGEPNDLGREFR
ncbi:MAG: cell division ATP-binding protein FtsE [bacterium]|nr:cell division ATP-binding protein FtsE [bacterium]